MEVNQDLAFLQFGGGRGEEEFALVLGRLGLVDVQSVLHPNGYYMMLISELEFLPFFLNNRKI
jgi:hypothetical protein